MGGGKKKKKNGRVMVAKTDEKRSRSKNKGGTWEKGFSRTPQCQNRKKRQSCCRERKKKFRKAAYRNERARGKGLKGKE